MNKIVVVAVFLCAVAAASAFGQEANSEAKTVPLSTDYYVIEYRVYDANGNEVTIQDPGRVPVGRFTIIAHVKREFDFGDDTSIGLGAYDNKITKYTYTVEDTAKITFNFEEGHKYLLKAWVELNKDDEKYVKSLIKSRMGDLAKNVHIQSTTSLRVNDVTDAAAYTTGSAEGFSVHVPVIFGGYFQGGNMNSFSIGVPFQVGLQFNFGHIASIALLGEAGFGFGYPYLAEGNVGGAAKLYVAKRVIGLGAGAGLQGAAVPWNIFDYGELPETTSSTYYRLEVIFMSMISLYAQHYSYKPWNDIQSWGFGLLATVDTMGHHLKK